MINRERLLHIRHFLHFSGNRNEIDKIDENYDKWWKIQDVSEILNMAFSKFQNLSKHLIVDKEADFK
jgi:hypothetical protein